MGRTGQASATADRPFAALGRVAPWAGLAAWAVVGSFAVGLGPVNGDAAVYANQAARGDLLERPTHALWVAIAWLVGDPRALDVVNLGAGVALVAAVASRSGWAGMALAGLAWPFAPFAEVDVPWLAALAWARRVDVRPAALLTALAVALSPSALLAVPWLADARRDRAWLGAVAGLAGVFALGGIEVWSGHRGLWTAATWTPGAAAASMAWTLGPALWVLRRSDAIALPLLLGPADAPLGLLLVARPRPISPWLAFACLAWGGARLVGAAERVQREAQYVSVAAARLGPRDALVAPWSWGVRVSLASTGDAYALRWRPPRGFVRDQAEPWCKAPAPETVWHLRSDGTTTLGPWDRSDCP